MSSITNSSPNLSQSCAMLNPSRYTMYLQHALLLLLPPFLTLSLLIRVPRPAVSPLGLGQHRDWHLIDPTTRTHIHTHTRQHARIHSKISCTHSHPPTTQSHTDWHQCAHTSTTKDKRRKETEIFGLPQQHYSNASQRTPTKREKTEKERDERKWKIKSSLSHWLRHPHLACYINSTQE